MDADFFVRSLKEQIMFTGWRRELLKTFSASVACYYYEDYSECFFSANVSLVLLSIHALKGKVKRMTWILQTLDIACTERALLPTEYYVFVAHHCL